MARLRLSAQSGIFASDGGHFCFNERQLLSPQHQTYTDVLNDRVRRWNRTINAMALRARQSVSQQLALCDRKAFSGFRRARNFLEFHVEQLAVLDRNVRDGQMK
jgi:hypothetical protein